MTHNYIIVDDQPLARDLLESHMLHLSNYKLIASCDNALKAYAVLEEHKIDLMFLDIDMPVLKGNTFLKQLKNPPHVIFTTAHREYAMEGYDLNIVDYLLKPITFERFFKAIEKFNKLVSASTNTVQEKAADAIFIQSSNKHLKLVLDEILFVESSKDYITIHLDKQGELRIKHNISVFEKSLDERFLRIHRSFIVHKEKITAFTKNEVMIGPVEIPVGDSYRGYWKKYIDDIT